MVQTDQEIPILGATVPFGMVQLSPDIGIPGWDRIAGYFLPR
ncbi:hypothetical protein CCAN12_550034 [Capnocytophaga canimorsus]|uniref:Uncharacterized protein n=1 Tax=Capnocytophaga canimorsus TaxID=28188 RepID=A0A0B7H565_9FLAO|nr:hypothetical protein CCAN12_550034 [Capnocytophaga canimorsus]